MLDKHSIGIVRGRMSEISSAGYSTKSEDLLIRAFKYRALLLNRPFAFDLEQLESKSRKRWNCRSRLETRLESIQKCIKIHFRPTLAELPSSGQSMPSQGRPTVVPKVTLAKYT